MNDFKEQHTPLTNETESLQLPMPSETSLASSETNEQSKCASQAQMNEIQALKDRRDQLLSETERLQIELRPYESALESQEPIDPDQKRDIRNKYNDLKRVLDSRQYDAHLLDQKISRREELLNCEALMAGYVEAMSNWKAMSRN